MHKKQRELRAPRTNCRRLCCLLLGLMVALSPAFVRGEAKPDVVLTGEITRADYKTYRMLPFTVPAGIERITVTFWYTGREQHTALDLGLFDASGFRGWSGGNKDSFTIAETDATPSYLAGPIRAGQWKLAIGVPNIRPDVRSVYIANIFYIRGQRPNAEFISPLRDGPAWYRGDLHMHTAHSDGSCKSQTGKKVPCPVFRTLETMSQRGLDFIAITDHNATSQYDALRELAPYFDRLLLLHGREITTFQGHLNVFGTDQFVDFRIAKGELPNMDALLRQVKDLGGLASINHPIRPSGEECMGCGWTPEPDADLHLLQAVEAVNGIDADTAYSGIPFWEAHLNRGYKLTAIGGSDNHDADQSGPGSIGHPATVVYAKELSEAAVLEGLRAGQVFIDVEGSTHRALEFNATSNGSSAKMGEALPLRVGVNGEFSARLMHVGGDRLEVIQDGKAIDAAVSPAITGDDETKFFTLAGDGQRHWVRISVRSAAGKLLLVGNPIYLNW